MSKDNSNNADYSFYSISGDLVDFDDYKGKYSVLTFTFTRCPSICPAINLDLAKLRYKYGDNINILTISFNEDIYYFIRFFFTWKSLI